ncbi:hypothetical protein Pmar_PMAR027596 [Perkinsus marinus ATCC 50983]|uniref:RRM domain-containing protein n=1 Tax=Perkinsus marinus (strain ATCC 50983 / TXsc) TaxID=423536 RepID=C5KC68_PERM5|nr:hypothetical protein Pmar_PMAR027596 [Perkinsus marinus ATCC 50983]EER17881.1 hypothetical protein Pmar_PMAR027596 [Perkinsus marinus ATCC 50983]|eukprot:XP_002786085.1 hypothetical protein Pmar_PMAR027596 [Perkinsus marinus ATCC 50983]
MSQPGTPVAYYQTLYNPIAPGTPQMTPQSPAGSVRSVGSYAPIGYTTGNYPSPPPPAQGEYGAPVYQLPYGAIPQQQQQQQQTYGYPSPSPVAAAYYGAYIGNPAMVRSTGGSPTNSVCSLSSDSGIPQSPMINPMQMSPMNIAPPMVLQRDSSGNMILPPVGYFVRDAENVDPENLCYADIRQNKAGPPGSGDSARTGNFREISEQEYRNFPERKQQREEGYRRGNRHHHNNKQQQVSQQVAVHEGSGKTLRTLLQELDEEDENCIFIVRRIHKFGFKSPVFLREYFEEYGQVRKVLVAHSRQLQPGPNDTTRTRSRPASLGFVLMANSESVQRILADGPAHMIADVEITIDPAGEQTPQQRVELLDELVDFVSQIDNAINLNKIGGKINSRIGFGNCIKQ